MARAYLKPRTALHCVLLHTMAYCEGVQIAKNVIAGATLRRGGL
jgi:hypothetical protein